MLQAIAAVDFAALQPFFATAAVVVVASVVVSSADVDRALEVLRAAGDDAYVIGEIIEGDEGVVFA